MKLSAIKRQCLAAGEIIIFEDGDRQWLGTYSACWPVENVCLTRESVIELFDLSLKQVSVLDINVMQMDESALFGDPQTAREATPIMEIVSMGKRLTLLECDGEVLLVDEQKVRTGCSEPEYRSITIWRKADGQPVAVVSDGLIHCAYIVPESEEIAGDIMRRCRHIARLRTRGEFTI